MACGRRFGKTAYGIDRLSEVALEGHPVGWFAPSNKFQREAWRDFVRYLRPATARTNQQEWRIELVTGGSIEFWSLVDPDAGRSRKYKRIVIDEAAKVRNLEAAWNEAIRPTLTDLEGDADFYSTPKGHDFFWRCFARAQSGDDPEWACWQIPTAANPYINPAEIEAARLQLPERVFQQEYLAMFLEDAGGVFRGVNAVVGKGRTANEPRVAGRRYWMGADLARVEDFTVLTVLDSFGRQVHHERFNQVSWERASARIVAVARAYDATCFLDSTGVGDPIFERIRREGVRVRGYTFTNASKEELIDNLAIKIESGEVLLMDVPAQTAELLAFQYELTPSRNVRMGAPEGMHDDCVIGLALAAWGLKAAVQWSVA